MLHQSDRGTPDGGGPSGISKKKRKRQSDHSTTVCTHCKTSKTPMWRRGEGDVILCNRCGLFWARHGVERPLDMEHYQRARSSSTVSESAALLNRTSLSKSTSLGGGSGKLSRTSDALISPRDRALSAAAAVGGGSESSQSSSLSSIQARALVSPRLIVTATAQAAAQYARPTMGSMLLQAPLINVPVASAAASTARQQQQSSFLDSSSTASSATASVGGGYSLMAPNECETSFFEPSFFNAIDNISDTQSIMSDGGSNSGNSYSPFGHNASASVSVSSISALAPDSPSTTMFDQLSSCILSNSQDDIGGSLVMNQELPTVFDLNGRHNNNNGGGVSPTAGVSALDLDFAMHHDEQLSHHLHDHPPSMILTTPSGSNAMNFSPSFSTTSSGNHQRGNSGSSFSMELFLSGL